ncbi:MAG TPA: efflux RND transporter periplasmic adaptor subunit [Gemmatimonadales bacterium]|nr:efflux RND transporter periplasmic adaptor subunit [Gemmatimonadales bacterium]
MTRILPLLALAALAACGAEAAPDEVAPAAVAGVLDLDEAQARELQLAVDTVRLEDVAVPLDVPAMVVTPDPATAHLGSIVEGRVVRVPVLPGDRVRAGDVLVVLHSHELATARRDLIAAEAATAAARAAVERSDRLLAAGAVAREEVEQRRSALAAAEAERARAEEMVSHLHPDGEEATIVAPADGTVLAVHVNVGEAVVVGEPLVDVGDARTLWVTGWVPERAVPQVGTGREARVTLAAFPGDTFAARVVRSGGALDPERRALDVRVVLTAPPPGLVPGMYATLILPTGELAPRAILPAEAVQRTADGAGVYLREGPLRFRFHPVAAATALTDGTIAVDGLPEGVEIVTRGAYRLRAISEIGPGE